MATYRRELHSSHLATAFFLFAASRLLSARFNNINDCDETYNYWEPAHFLLYGRGFQTWEYSPQYAIRSYFYLWLYMVPASVARVLHIDKITIFYLTRAFLALSSAFVETFFYSTIAKVFGRNVAKYYILFSLFAPGMFNSTTAFLPSSFGQIMVCLAIGFWLRDHYRSFIFFTAFSAIVGWPFTAAICIPMALKVLISPRYTRKFIVWSAASGLLISALTVAVDSYYYGKVVFASLNIVLYNVFSSNGPELYGIEPASYYVSNLFLNFNVASLLSACSALPLVGKVLARKQIDQSSAKELYTISALYIWLCIFFHQPHKEERFMYPVYPLISLTAAFTLEDALQILTSLLPKQRKIFNLLTNLCFVLFILLSLSRTAALYKGYGASMHIYEKLNDLPVGNQTDQRETQAVLCLAKEWHRFPSNFFIPSRFRVEFIPSEFRGQLPKHFDSSSKHPTRVIPSHMNDQNKEETSRFVSPSRCDLIIDSDYPHEQGRDIAYSRTPAQWALIHSLPFLDSSRSPGLYRAFYIPVLSEQHCTYIGYNLLWNKNSLAKQLPPS